MVDNNSVTIRKAFELLKAGNTLAALKMIETTNEEIENATFHSVRGMCFANLKKYDEAVESYTKSLVYDDKNALVHNNLGNVYRNLKRYNSSISCFKLAILLRPDVTSFYFNYANTCLEMADFRKAKKVFSEALSIDPKSVVAHIGIAKCLTNEEFFEEAIERLLLALEIEPTNKELVEGLLFLLSICSPTLTFDNDILKFNKLLNDFAVDGPAKIQLDNKNKCLNELFVKTSQSMVTCLRTKKSQIFRSNELVLGCRRHKKVVETKNIIPAFCFSCFKVEVNIHTLGDLIILYSYFSTLKLPENNIRKTMVELRKEFPGFYKGLIYSQNLSDAQSILNLLDHELSLLLKGEFNIKIKRGCSEYPSIMPNFDKVSIEALNACGYPPDWAQIENAFDDKVGKIETVLENFPSIASFNLFDFLIFRNWIGYGLGIGDLDAVKFEKQFGSDQKFLNLGRTRSEYHRYCN